MKIRPVESRDRDEWVRMRASLYGDVPPAEVDRWLAKRDSDGTSEVGVAVLVVERDDGSLGGFVEIGLRSYAEGCESSPVPYLEGWYVDADLRGAGIGRALLGHVEGWAAARGFTEIASDAEIANSASIAAHTALGFVEVERQACFRKKLDR